MEIFKELSFQFIDKTKNSPKQVADVLAGLETEEENAVQDLRWILAIIMTTVIEDILDEENRTRKHPYLANPGDEKSDLITELDFGRGFRSRLRIPFGGDIQFDNRIFAQILRDFRSKIAEFLCHFIPGSRVL